jgi:hypothetical protein
MGLMDHEEMIDSLPTAGLVRFAREYIALSTGESGELQSDAGRVLDLLCAEFLRRGQERLYDATRKAVARTATSVPRVSGNTPVEEQEAELPELDFDMG